MVMMKDIKEVEGRLVKKKIENIQKTIADAMKLVSIVVYIIALA